MKKNKINLNEVPDLPLDEKIAHCELAIKVCSERIKVEGDGACGWVKLKELWIIELNQLTAEKENL